MNNEVYVKDPVEALEDILEACLWERVAPHLWEKGRSRIFVDEIGIFLFRGYRNYKPARWVRTHGLAHLYIRHLPQLFILFPDEYKLNLLTG